MLALNGFHLGDPISLSGTMYHLEALGKKERSRKKKKKKFGMK